MTTKVYRYGLLAPTAEAARVEESMRIAHAYRNRLVEIERDRRARLRKIDTADTEALRLRVVACRESLDEAIAEQRRERARTRKRATSAELRERIKDARSALKTATAVWREQRNAARDNPEAQKARDEIREQFLAARRDARPGRKNRPDDGIDSGTYQLIEDAASQSFGSLPLWDGEQPNDPRFMRWTGEGAISVQIVGGTSVDSVLDGSHTQVGIIDRDLGDDRRDPKSRRSRLRRRVTLRIRVGSEPDRSPVWAEFPCVMHRPLPAGGCVKRVTVIRRLIGPREEWCAQFVVTAAAPTVRHVSRSNVVAIDIGWRQIDDELRVAAIYGTDGDRSEIRLPPELLGAIRKVEDLRSIRDKRTDEIRARLLEWISEHGEPEALAGQLEHLAQWRAPARFAALALRWRDSGPACEMRDELEAWRKQDKHLWLWETSQRTKSLRRRRDLYRCLAADLAERFGVCVLEKFDLRTMAKLDRESDAADNATSRSNRVVASLSELRTCIRNAFASRGGLVVEVDPKNTTQECAVCGEHVGFDAARELRATCSNGHEWDQDDNAAKNIFERWRDAQDSEPEKVTEEPTESRRDRVRRMHAERKDRMSRDA